MWRSVGIFVACAGVGCRDRAESPHLEPNSLLDRVAAALHTAKTAPVTSECEEVDIEVAPGLVLNCSAYSALGADLREQDVRRIKEVVDDLALSFGVMPHNEQYVLWNSTLFRRFHPDVELPEFDVEWTEYPEGVRFARVEDKNLEIALIPDNEQAIEAVRTRWAVPSDQYVFEALIRAGRPFAVGAYWQSGDLSPDVPQASPRWGPLPTARLGSVRTIGRAIFRQRPGSMEGSEFSDWAGEVEGELLFEIVTVEICDGLWIVAMSCPDRGITEAVAVPAVDANGEMRFPVREQGTPPRVGAMENVIEDVPSSLRIDRHEVFRLPWPGVAAPAEAFCAVRWPGRRAPGAYAFVKSATWRPFAEDLRFVTPVKAADLGDGRCRFVGLHADATEDEIVGLLRAFASQR